MKGLCDVEICVSSAKEIEGAAKADRDKSKLAKGFRVIMPELMDL